MKIQEYTSYDCDNDAPILLKSKIIISRFVTEDPERANLFTSVYLYKSAYCLLMVMVEMLENYFPEIDFGNYFQLCINSNCYPKKVCELSRKNLNRKNKRLANYVFFELITHVICSIVSIYDKHNDEELMQEHYGNAKAYFYETRQKEIDRTNGSCGRASRTEEEKKLRTEFIRLYNALGKNKKSKPAITLCTDLHQPLFDFIQKEKLDKKDYTARTIENWINEYRSEIKKQSRG